VTTWTLETDDPPERVKQMHRDVAVCPRQTSSSRPAASRCSVRYPPEQLNAIPAMIESSARIDPPAAVLPALPVAAAPPRAGRIMSPSDRGRSFLERVQRLDRSSLGHREFAQADVLAG
jgi:hypothetical protein